MQKTKERVPADAFEEGDPLVCLIISPRGIEKALVLNEESNVEAAEKGHMLLARIASQMTLINNALTEAVG